MSTLSFKEFSQGKPVSVVGNESQAQQMEQESGQPSLMSKLGQRAKDFGKEALTLGTLGASTLDPNTPQADKTLATVEGLTKAGVAPVKMLGAVGGAVGDVFGAGLQATGLDKPLGEALAPIAQSEMAQKAVQAFKSLPQEYQELLTAGGEASNLIGLGVGKKAVTTGLEAGAKTIGKLGVPESVSGAVSKVTPTSEGIMQRVARIPKGEQAKFEQLAGESVGSYLDKRGIYGTPDKIVENLYNRFQQSKATADDALATIQGTYRADPIKTALTELEGKVKRTSSPGAPDPDLARVNELVAKEQTQGLTMSEINEVKRIYERRVRLDYLKSNVPEDVTRATNVDSALRTWQLAEAEKAGLTNLAEINKETQLSRRLMDALGKEQAGIGGNNALGLTDAILLAGGSPESIASLLVKKTLSDKGLQSFVAKKISKNKEKIGVPTANFKSSKPSIQQSEGKVLLPSTKSTPTPTKSKGIRGMVNPSELNPFKSSIRETYRKSIELNNKVDELSKQLNEFSGKGGLITEEVRKSQEFVAIKNEYNKANSEMLKFNTSTEGKSLQNELKKLGMSERQNLRKEIQSELVPKKKVVSSLEQEAKKYKSAEEFVQRTISKETGFKDSHVAPGFDNTPVKKKMDTGGDFSLKEVANGYSNQPSDYFDPKVGARYYGYDNLAGRQSETAINNIIRAEKNGITDRTITAYRTVPKDTNVTSLENGEWITFSEEYAKQHGLHRFDGKYKIIKQEVKPTEVWWDGNDINEWGFDNGKGGGRKTQMAREKELTDIWNKANKK